MQPFYLGTVLWGAEFRRYFLRYCVPSLLAPGNLPSLPPDVRHRWLLCTTAQDEDALRAHPIMERLARWVAVEFLPLPGTAHPSQRQAVIAAMSQGHRLIAERMFADRVRGTFVYPDTVFADGAMVTALKRAEEGKTAVLVLCPRLAHQGFLTALEARGVVEGEPLVIPPREGIRLALENLHAETASYLFDAPGFDGRRAMMALWRAPDGGILAHSLHWAYLMLDYGALTRHDTTTFVESSIDADYVYRNFGTDPGIHVLTDSDEATLVSFSVDAVPLLPPPFPSALEGDAVLLRIHDLRRRLCAFDPLRGALFSVPVRLHAGDEVWEAVEARAARVVAAVQDKTEPARARWVAGCRDGREAVIRGAHRLAGCIPPAGRRVLRRLIRRPH